MNEGKLGKPILKPCPQCENDVITQWYWTYEDEPIERVLKAVECSHEVEPEDLGFENYLIWKNDPDNFYPQPLEKVGSKEKDFTNIIPESRKVSHSSVD